jgi:hypothetical protein
MTPIDLIPIGAQSLLTCTALIGDDACGQPSVAVAVINGRWYGSSTCANESHAAAALADASYPLWDGDEGVTPPTAAEMQSLDTVWVED